jgi:hypothetical protein
MSDKKRCSKCHELQPTENFWVRKSGEQAGKIFSWCKTCVTAYSKDWKHRTGRQRSMKTNRSCPAFLGVNIAERILSRFFDHIERMPYKNSGYDFICGKGFKIDCKSSCLRIREKQTDRWEFYPERNTTADHFICLAFDDRKNLEPLHVWLIPGFVINKKRAIKISNTPKSIAKWSQYERPLGKIVTCCDSMKTEVKA